MALYDKTELGKQAREIGFVRDTFEKVLRLAKILQFINSTSAVSELLALKGGTAVNLTVFNLPRLSVDIDMDFNKNCSREEMLADRKIISDFLRRFVKSEGYNISSKSKFTHSLDSYVLNYKNSGGVNDAIKIEINYSMRCHIFESELRYIETGGILDSAKIRTLAPIEIFASKINALISRAAARDLYDINNMILYSLFDEQETELLRQCVIFYIAVGGRSIPKDISFSNVMNITPYVIKRDLRPVIKSNEHFSLDTAQNRVMTFLEKVMQPTELEQQFLNCFSKGEFIPELLFNDNDILCRVKTHPMAEWKLRGIKNKENPL